MSAYLIGQPGQYSESGVVDYSNYSQQNRQAEDFYRQHYDTYNPAAASVESANTRYDYVKLIKLTEMDISHG